MTRFLLGTLCTIALGCNTSTPTTSDVDSTQEKPTTITTNRPNYEDDRQRTDQTMDRDNTGVNVRDRDDSAKTSISQIESEKDVDITAKIRKRVVDTEMSVNAQNVKIITQDGKVTLRGPVKSVDEKTQIEKLAQEVAGTENVDNQLEVQP